MLKAKWRSWYMFAPVATIQSMNPWFIRGMMVEGPIPAGVMAPAMLNPIVTSFFEYSSFMSWHAALSRPPLYASKLSTSSAMLLFFVMGFGRTRFPDRYWFLLG